jgi:hypothetical protein
MPRFPRRNHSPANLICPIEACGKECRSHSGLTQHLNSKHEDYQLGLGTPPSAAAVNDLFVLDSDVSSLNDAEISPGSDLGDAWDAFSSNHDNVGFDFETPLIPSSRPHSPYQESQASESSSSTSVDYHPLINGQ